MNDQASLGLRLRPVQEWRTEVYNVIADFGQLRHYPRRSIVFSQGDEATAVYALKRGLIEICGINESGQEVSYSVRGPGSTFGYSELILRTQGRVRNAVALDDTDLWVLDHRRFMRILAARPQLTLALLGSSLDRITRLNEMRADLRGSTAKSRVAYVLALLASQSQPVNTQSHDVIVRMTHEALGRVCDLSRQTVTSILGELQTEGAVELRSRCIAIQDLARLQRIVEDAR